MVERVLETVDKAKMNVQVLQGYKITKKMLFGKIGLKAQLNKIKIER